MTAQEMTGATRDKLRNVRQVLLRLHKTLLDFEREGYEREHGEINNSYEFLNLAMNNAWFAWLRQLSEIIVQMDELLDAREDTAESTALALIDEARLLLTPAEGGGDFQRKYFAAMQQSPEVVMEHAEFVKVLGPGRLSKEVH